MKAPLNLGRATIAGLLGVLVVLLGNAGAAAWNFREVETNNRWVAHTHEVLAGLAELPAALTDLGRALSVSPQAHEEAAGHLAEPLERLEQLTADNPRQQDRLGRLRQVVPWPPTAVADGPWLAEALGLAADLRAEEVELLHRRVDASRRSSVTAGITLAVASLAAVAALGLCLSLVRRDAARWRHAQDALHQAKLDLERDVRQRAAELERQPPCSSLWWIALRKA
jgi:CHASE3 domain sensor protein